MANESHAQHQEDIEVPPIPKETAGAVAGAALGSVMGLPGASGRRNRRGHRGKGRWRRPFEAGCEKSGRKSYEARPAAKYYAAVASEGCEAKARTADN